MSSLHRVLNCLSFFYIYLRNKRVINLWYFKQKSTKNFLGGGTAPSQTFPPVGGGGGGKGDTPSSTLRRLRPLHPSHSKILGTPLINPTILGPTWTCDFRAVDSTSEKRLITMLVENYRQNGVDGRPVVNTSTAMTVTISFSLIQILQFESTQRIITLVGWISLVYTRPQLLVSSLSVVALLSTDNLSLLKLPGLLYFIL